MNTREILTQNVNFSQHIYVFTSSSRCQCKSLGIQHNHITPHHKNHHTHTDKDVLSKNQNAVSWWYFSSVLSINIYLIYLLYLSICSSIIHIHSYIPKFLSPSVPPPSLRPLPTTQILSIFAAGMAAAAANRLNHSRTHSLTRSLNRSTHSLSPLS